ncbi:hypothetical protein GGU45_003653 [Niabella hirudinis]
MRNTAVTGISDDGQALPGTKRSVLQDGYSNVSGIVPGWLFLYSSATGLLSLVFFCTAMAAKMPRAKDIA